jgi:hypothetical protein
MSRELNRRAILAGTAAIVPAAAVAGVPALASPDAELIELGRQLEQAVVAHLEAFLRLGSATLRGSSQGARAVG